MLLVLAGSICELQDFFSLILSIPEAGGILLHGDRGAERSPV